MERKVGIVGAGVSGLLACKYALSKGYHPLVFETQGSIGGVWTKTFETTKLQTPKSLYQFSDYPWPSSMETVFPDHNQVFDYLQSHATHFDLIKHIKFNSKVVSIKYEGSSDDEIRSWTLWDGNGEPFGNKGNWILTVQDLVEPSTEVKALGDPHYGLCCLGQSRKRLTVVGFQKSALDLAMECSTTNGNVYFQGFHN